MIYKKVIASKPGEPHIELEMSDEEIAKRQAEERAWEQEKERYEQEEAYKDKRRAEYPPIGDQLDALYHAMDLGVLKKVDGFYDKIKAVKDKYPKPENV